MTIEVKLHLIKDLRLSNKIIHIKFQKDKNFKENDVKERFIFKYENDLMQPLLTFEVKLHRMKKNP